MDRRKVLQTASIVSTVAIAGCLEVIGPNSDDTVSPEPPPVSPELDHTGYEIRENGTTLYVEMEGGADIKVEKATITFGDRSIEVRPNETAVSIAEHLEDVHLTNGEDGSIVYTIVDVQGNETSTEIRPESPKPTLALKTVPTEASGTIEISLQAEDEHGLSGITVGVGDESFVNRGPAVVGGQDQFVDEAAVTVDTIPGVKLGRMNTITGSVTDWNGNSSSASSETYVREFDPIIDERVTVGAFYVYFFDDPAMWDECTDAEPAIGRYSMRDTEAVSRHVDLLQGHGINRVIFQADSPDNAADFLDRLDEPMGTTMEIEIKFTWVAPVTDWRGDRSIGEMFDWITDYFRDTFLVREQYARRNGRPVVTIWDANHPVATDGEVADFVADEFGDYAGFVGYLREQFTVDVEPHLVGMAMNLHTIGPDVPEVIRNALTHYDALTHWFGIDAVRHEQDIDPGEPTPWEAVRSYHEKYYPVARKYVETHDMDFIPTVFFGFDDRSNDCWGADRYLPRDPSHL